MWFQKAVLSFEISIIGLKIHWSTLSIKLFSKQPLIRVLSFPSCWNLRKANFIITEWSRIRGALSTGGSFYHLFQWNIRNSLKRRSPGNTTWFPYEHGKLLIFHFLLFLKVNIIIFMGQEWLLTRYALSFFIVAQDTSAINKILVLEQY